MDGGTDSLTDFIFYYFFQGGAAGAGTGRAAPRAVCALQSHLESPCSRSVTESILVLSENKIICNKTDTSVCVPLLLSPSWPLQGVHGGGPCLDLFWGGEGAAAPGSPALMWGSEGLGGVWSFPIAWGQTGVPVPYSMWQRGSPPGPGNSPPPPAHPGGFSHSTHSEEDPQGIPPPPGLPPLGSAPCLAAPRSGGWWGGKEQLRL